MVKTIDLISSIKRSAFSLILLLFFLSPTELFAQEDCKEAFKINPFSGGAKAWYVDVAYMPSIHVLDPAIDTSINSFRSLVHLGIGKSAAKKFEWGISFQWYYNDVTAIRKYSSVSFFATNHIELGLQCWYALNKTKSLKITAGWKVNFVKPSRDSYKAHISAIHLGMRYYKPINRKIHLYLEPGWNANPYYLSGSQVSLLTYNYGYYLQIGARFHFL